MKLTGKISKKIRITPGGLGQMFQKQAMEVIHRIYSITLSCLVIDTLSHILMLLDQFATHQGIILLRQEMTAIPVKVI